MNNPDSKSRHSKHHRRHHHHREETNPSKRPKEKRHHHHHHHTASNSSSMSPKHKHRDYTTAAHAATDGKAPMILDVAQDLTDLMSRKHAMTETMKHHSNLIGQISHQSLFIDTVPKHEALQIELKRTKQQLEQLCRDVEDHAQDFHTKLKCPLSKSEKKSMAALQTRFKRNKNKDGSYTHVEPLRSKAKPLLSMINKAKQQENKKQNLTFPKDNETKSVAEVNTTPQLQDKNMTEEKQDKSSETYENKTVKEEPRDRDDSLDLSAAEAEFMEITEDVKQTESLAEEEIEINKTENDVKRGELIEEKLTKIPKIIKSAVNTIESTQRKIANLDELQAEYAEMEKLHRLRQETELLSMHSSLMSKVGTIEIDENYEQLIAEQEMKNKEEQMEYIAFMNVHSPTNRSKSPTLNISKIKYDAVIETVKQQQMQLTIARAEQIAAIRKAHEEAAIAAKYHVKCVQAEAKINANATLHESE